MAFMMPVVKNDWDIYNSQRRRPEGEGRVRKVSESRSESAAAAAAARPALSPHRSAPAMRALSYSRPPPRASRASLRADPPRAAPPPRDDKFHSRARADSPQRSRCAGCVPYL